MRWISRVSSTTGGALRLRRLRPASAYVMSRTQPLNLEQLSPELIRLVTSHAQTEGLKNLRLVNKTLNSHAQGELFRHVFLSPADDVMQSWNHIARSKLLSNIPRQATIQSRKSIGLYDFDEEESDGVSDDNDQVSCFTEAIHALTKLKKVSSLQISFAPQCVGKWSSEQLWEIGNESAQSREKLLQLVFEAVEERSNSRDSSAIRALTIEHLQNYPIEFTKTDVFRSVIGRLDQLHISMVQEINGRAPDNDYDCKELRTFPPHLVSQWLAPVSPNLKALSLYHATDNWGPFPGRYDFSSLSFRKLETLCLGYFTIAHDDQLDWVLAQKSLKKLVLQNCMIASDICIANESMEEWEVNSQNWEPVKNGHGWAKCFRYPAKWSHFFDKIADNLPNLEEIQFDYNADGHDGNYSIVKRDTAKAWLYPRRYVIFNHGILPTHWPEACTDGSVSASFWDDEAMNRNFHQENLEGDQQSLDRLLEKCKQRAGRG